MTEYWGGAQYTFSHYLLIILKILRGHVPPCPPPPYSAVPVRARFIRYIWFISGDFFPFQFFIVPIHRAITKNISESTCGKSTYQLACRVECSFLEVVSHCTSYCLAMPICQGIDVPK